MRDNDRPPTLDGRGRGQGRKMRRLRRSRSCDNLRAEHPRWANRRRVGASDSGKGQCRAGAGGVGVRLGWSEDMRQVRAL